MATIIKTDGKIIKLNNPTFKDLQTAVNGYVEIIALDKDNKMIVNDEGRLSGLPINKTATETLQRHHKQKTIDILGDAVVLNKNDDPQIFNKV